MAYKITEQKNVFCNEYITDLKQLEARKLPKCGAFYSKLKNANISKEEYDKCIKIGVKRNEESKSFSHMVQ